jgi:hypothetical protein
MTLTMAEKRQFKMYLDDELRQRVKEAATRFNRSSGQEVVEEILSTYLPTWVAVNAAMNRAIDVQAQRRLSEAADAAEYFIQTGPGVGSVYSPKTGSTPDAIKVTKEASESATLKGKTVRPKNEKSERDDSEVRKPRERRRK